MSSEVSLWNLDQTLADMLDLRGEMSANGEDCASIDEQIRQYALINIPRKVDACASIAFWKQSRQTAIKAEIARLSKALAVEESNYNLLLEYFRAVLEKQPKPEKGSRKLAGNLHSISLQKNGGVAPVIIDRPDLVPDECCYAELRMPWNLWVAISWAGNQAVPPDQADLVKENRIPSKDLIRKELEQPCPVCAGRFRFSEMPCTVCGGSGHQGVAGCSLGERGESVRVR